MKKNIPCGFRKLHPPMFLIHPLRIYKTKIYDDIALAICQRKKHPTIDEDVEPGF